MDKYVDAYGTIHNKLLFIAIRFRKPIIKIQINKNSESIETSNIVVLYSNKPVNFQSNTLTFIVKAECHNTDVIPVETGLESELLLSTLNKSEILYYTYYNSVLYACGTSNIISYTYDVIAKTTTFRALNKIITAYRKNKLNVEHYALCHYFKRNKLKWKKWNSWWYFIRERINEKYKEKAGVYPSLRTVKNLNKLFKNSKTLIVDKDYSKLRYCEISLEEMDNVGVLCISKNMEISYVSPMIISKQGHFKPLRDVNNKICNKWFPLYINKNNWLNNSIYFYSNNIRLNIIYIRKMLKYLENTTIEKYKNIQENLVLILKLVTYPPKK